MDNTNTSRPTKVCASCGQEKPMSAFLELSGDQAGHYGNICGTCRKTYLEQSKPKDEASGKTGTGHKIDSKAKVAGDIDRQEEAASKEEQYHQERDEEELEQSDNLDKDDLRKQDERKHHQSFLDRRTAITDKKKAQAEAANSHFAVQENTKEQSNTSESAREEQKKTGFDFYGPVQDTYIAGKEKYKGVHIRQFATWAGKGSAIGRRLGSQNPAAGSEPASKTEEKNQTLAEHLENNFGPGSRKR